MSGYGSLHLRTGKDSYSTSADRYRTFRRRPIPDAPITLMPLEATDRPSDNLISQPQVSQGYDKHLLQGTRAFESDPL
jgi:hypothetical protein